MAENYVKGAISSRRRGQAFALLFFFVVGAAATYFVFKPFVYDQFQSTYTEVVATSTAEGQENQKMLVGKRARTAHFRTVTSDVEYKGENLSLTGRSEEIPVGTSVKAWVQDANGELTLHYAEKSGASTKYQILAGVSVLVLLGALWLFVTGLIDTNRLAQKASNPATADLRASFDREVRRRVEESDGDEPYNVYRKAYGTVTQSSVQKLPVGTRIFLETLASEMPDTHSEDLALAFVKSGADSGEVLVFDEQNRTVWVGRAGDLVAFIDDEEAERIKSVQ